MGGISVEIDRFVNLSKKRLDELVYEVVLDFASELILRSPVDTGRFVANWQYSYQRPPVTYDWNSADPERIYTIRLIESQVPKAASNKKHRFTNLLPYATLVESIGWKNTAPYAPMALTMQQLPQMFKGRIAAMKGKK